MNRLDKLKYAHRSGQMAATQREQYRRSYAARTIQKRPIIARLGLRFPSPFSEPGHLEPVSQVMKRQ